jgi:hypothetical protein
MNTRFEARREFTKKPQWDRFDTKETPDQSEKQFVYAQHLRVEEFVPITKFSISN